MAEDDMKEKRMTEWTPELVLQHVNKLLEDRDTLYREQITSLEKIRTAEIVAMDKVINTTIVALRTELQLDVTSKYTANHALIQSLIKQHQTISEQTTEWYRLMSDWHTTALDHEKGFARQEDLKILTERMDTKEGQSVGHRELYTWIIPLLIIATTALTHFWPSRGQVETQELITSHEKTTVEHNGEMIKSLDQKIDLLNQTLKQHLDDMLKERK